MIHPLPIRSGSPSCHEGKLLIPQDIPVGDSQVLQLSLFLGIGGSVSSYSRSCSFTRQRLSHI